MFLNALAQGFCTMVALNRALLEDMKSNRERITDPVLAVEVVQRESIYGYHANRSARFLRITLALPRLIAAAKRLLGEGKVYVTNLGTPVYEAYESNIDFEIRYHKSCQFVYTSGVLMSLLCDKDKCRAVFF